MTFDTMLILYEHKYIKLFQVINIKIKTLKINLLLLQHWQEVLQRKN